MMTTASLSLHPYTQLPALDYAAILSGLSMAGDFISDTEIEQARNLHRQNPYGRAAVFTSATVSPLKVQAR